MTASRLPAQGAVSRAPGDGSASHSLSSVNEHNAEMNFLDDGRSSEASYSSALPQAGLPLSFGEQLVLETYIHCKRRPYDRERQDILAQPKNRVTDPNMSSSGSGLFTSLDENSEVRRLDSQKVAELVDRLTKKSSTDKKRAAGSSAQGQDTDGAEAGASLKEKQQSVKRKDFDIKAMIERLNTPRMKDLESSTGPGDHHSRRSQDNQLLDAEAEKTSTAASSRLLDLEHINRLARPRKCGASAEAWGLSSEWSQAESNTGGVGAATSVCSGAVGSGYSCGSRTARDTTSYDRSKMTEGLRDSRWSRAGAAEDGRPIAPLVYSRSARPDVTSAPGVQQPWSARLPQWQHASPASGSGRGPGAKESERHCGAQAPSAGPAPRAHLDSAWASACRTRAVAPSEATHTTTTATQALASMPREEGWRSGVDRRA